MSVKHIVKGGSEYRSGTLSSIYRYFELNCEPFIKGLLRDKGGIEYSMFLLDSKMDEVRGLMDRVVEDYDHAFRSYSDMPLYLYNKVQYSNDRLRCTLVWRISRKIVGQSNTMINRLFREDRRYDFILEQFGPAMLEQIRDYDRCRLILNTLYSTLNFQHKSVGLYQDAIGLMNDYSGYSGMEQAS